MTGFVGGGKGRGRARELETLEFIDTLFRATTFPAFFMRVEIGF